MNPEQLANNILANAPETAAKVKSEAAKNGVDRRTRTSRYPYDA